MKFINMLILLSIAFLSGCVSRPYEHTSKVFDTGIIQPTEGIVQSKITIHRQKQFIGAGLDESCQFIVSINNHEIAILQQNRYLIVYLDKGEHQLRVYNQCAAMSMGMRKTINIYADGSEQWYETENGSFGQYRIWRTK